MPYRLPRQPYKCGIAGTGLPCQHGPIGSRCGLEHQAEQPVCRPVRTLHWWSKVAGLSLTLLTISILLGLSQWSTDKQWLAPGELTSPHAQILNARRLENQERCAACHPQGLIAPVGSDALASQSNDPQSSRLDGQSSLCLNCHRHKMTRMESGDPHDLPPDQLARLASQIAIPAQVVGAGNHRTIDWGSHPTQCGQCHREHQGAGHSLQTMDTHRCQACHQQRFESLANGHPEFQGYPYDRSKRIAFDHRKHRELHFAKKGESFQCQSCHVGQDETGAVGEVFRTVSFERACSSCHNASLQSAIGDGMIVLQVPSLHKGQWERAGIEIGDWPESASQQNEGTLPPIMRLLIGADPDGIELLKRLPASGKLSDLSPHSENDRKLVGMLAEKTRSLFQQLGNEGQPGLRQWVMALLHEPADTQKIWVAPWTNQLAMGLPPDLFRTAARDWFESGPDGSVVDRSLRRGQATLASQIGKSMPRSTPPSDDDLLLSTNPDDDLLTSGIPSGAASSVAGWKRIRAWEQLPGGGWMIDRQRMAIVYVPTGHADPLVPRWIELAEHEGIENAMASGVLGQCIQCHETGSVTRLAAIESRATSRGMQDRHWMNTAWKAERRPANVRELTRFSHTPHLSLPSLRDCQSCHAMQSAEGDRSANEFQPMQRTDCAACHRQGAAGDSCTQCHNYHVGELGQVGELGSSFRD